MLKNSEDKVNQDSVDFYVEDGNFIFTKDFHLKRASCCGNGCRNCPFDPPYKKGNTTIFIDNG